MVRKSLLLILVGLMMQPFAQAQVSSLVVYSEERSPFTLIMNNIPQHDAHTPIVRVEGVVPGTYQVSLVFQDTYFGQIDLQLPVFPDEEHIIQIRRRRVGDPPAGIRDILPADIINSQNMVLATDGNFVVISQFRLPILGQVISYYRPLQPSLPDVMGDPNAAGIQGTNTVNVGGNVNFGADVNMDGVIVEGQTTTTTTTVTTTVVEPDPVVYVPGYQGAFGCDVPMDDASFQVARSSISSKTFPSTQMTTAQQVAENNCLTVSQVKSIIQIFTYESDKLDFAKFAYDFTYDIQNYYRVNDEFTFESTISKLDEYIQSRR